MALVKRDNMNLCMEPAKGVLININVPVEFDQCLEYVSACTGKTKRILLMEGFLELVKKYSHKPG